MVQNSCLLDSTYYSTRIFWFYDELYTMHIYSLYSLQNLACVIYFPKFLVINGLFWMCE